MERQHGYVQRLKVGHRDLAAQNKSDGAFANLACGAMHVDQCYAYAGHLGRDSRPGGVH